MPIYEYDCGQCGTYEVLQKMSDPALTACEACGKPVQKLISHSSFALKGGGWYKDLYSSTKKDGGSSASPSAKSDSASSSDAKPAAAEAAPAAPAPAKTSSPT